MDPAGYVPTEFELKLAEMPLPEVWVFAHWKQSRRFNYNGCLFVSLAPLEIYDVRT
jgi:hypothetical protein